MTMTISEKVVFARAGRKTLIMGKITMVHSADPADLYATGGEALTASDFGLSRLNHVMLGASTTGYVATYDKANSKLKIFESGTADAALDELDNSSNINGTTFIFFASGIGLVASDV